MLKIIDFVKVCLSFFLVGDLPLLSPSFLFLVVFLSRETWQPTPPFFLSGGLAAPFFLSDGVLAAPLLSSFIFFISFFQGGGLALPLPSVLCIFFLWGPWQSTPPFFLSRGWPGSPPAFRSGFLSFWGDLAIHSSFLCFWRGPG